MSTVAKEIPNSDALVVNEFTTVLAIAKATIGSRSINQIVFPWKIRRSYMKRESSSVVFAWKQMTRHDAKY